MIVLGIDPGSLITGFGIVLAERNSLKHIDNGNIRLAAKKPLPVRLKEIHVRIRKLIAEYAPDVVALEEIFVARNVRSAMVLGHARGVVMLAAVGNDIDVKEYSARQVKQALVGNGNATKHQIQQMTKTILKLPEPALEDAADALAVAICHCQSMRFHERLQRRST